MSIDKRDLILRDLYYSPKTGYRSGEHLYQLAQSEGEDISRGYVRKWLQQQQAYTKFKKFTNPQAFRKTLVRDLGEQIQIDLSTFMMKHKNENDGYTYIITGIELLSRYGFGIPVKNKSGKVVAEGLAILLEEFKDRFYGYPKAIQFDEGVEFLNKDVKALLGSHDITYFTTHSKRKASIVERYNRTIKTKILKLFEHKGNHIWVDNLKDIVENYNTTVNRSIAEKPVDVTEDNKFVIWGRLFGHVVKLDPPKFKVGDKVRVLHFDSKYKGKEFQKWYRTKHPLVYKEGSSRPVRHEELSSRDKPPFSEDIFTIHEVLLGDPVVYKFFSDEAGVEILGKYYQDELSLVR